MATCVSCGAEITWKDGIPLDVHEQMRGPNRYAETLDGLKPVKPTADVLARTDHRETCPYKDGRRRVPR